MFYFNDPKTKEPSVSLSFVLIAFIVVLFGSVANVLGYVEKEPGPLMELFYATAALYFGRRVSMNNKIFSGKEKK